MKNYQPAMIDESFRHTLMEAVSVHELLRRKRGSVSGVVAIVEQG